MKTMTMRTWLIAVVTVVAFATGCDKLKTGSARNDAQVTSDVQAKINADAILTSKGIGVTTNNGVVTLSGTVANETERIAAANDASTVDGVKTVVNNLTAADATAAPMEPMPNPTAPATAYSSGRRATTTRGTRPSAPVQTANNAIPSPTGSADGSRATTTPGPAAVPTVTIPEGTSLIVRLNDPISSETAQEGDTFTAVLDDPVYVDNEIAIPHNATVRGRVVRVMSAGKFKGRSELALSLVSVAFNGKSYQINTNEWSKQGGSRGKNTAVKVGGGAAIGAIIGGIAGGGKGAAIGAGVGAGVGTGAQAVTKGEQINLKAEQALTFTLDAPIRVTPAKSARSTTESADNQ
jgi:hypothetical protein